MEMDIYRHILYRVNEWRGAVLEKLISKFGNELSVLKADKKALVDFGLSELLAIRISDALSKFEPETEQNLLNNQGIKILSPSNPNFPTLLRQVDDSPGILYYRGDISILSKRCLSVVGSRRVSGYGQSAMQKIFPQVVKSEIVTVSGLAYGVDGLIAKIAVENKFPTVAVLGGGIDKNSIYPKTHALLSERIIENCGCLVSEYPPGTPPLPHHFVARNRIIAGLSEATLVVEAAQKSGSLITTDFALSNGRDVLAIPSPITNENSEGSNKLIKDGARVVTCAQDILEIYGIVESQENSHVLNKIESELFEIISNQPTEVDTLIEQSGYNFSEVLTTITNLELIKLIKKLPTGEYIKV